MAALSGNLCVLSARVRYARTPRVHKSTPGRRACTVAVRSSFADSRGSELSSQYQELQNNGLTSVPISPSVRRDGSEEQDLTHREQQLWHRQEALWQQQLAHWQHERDSFIQREQALLAHIQQLHSHLTALATAHMQSNRTAGFINDDFDDVPVTASGEDRQATLAVAEMLANTASRDQQTAAEPPSSATNSSETTSVPLTGVLSKEPAPVPAPAGQESSSASPTALTPQGPPPPLRLGSDDIYWVHQLQAGLMAEGYYCGEEEMEDFIFESGTESAVLAFQACAGVEESGVADEATWRALLGDKYQPATPPVDEEILEETDSLDGPLEGNAAPSTPKQNSEAKDANPWEASWGDLFSSEEADTEFDRDSSQSSTSSPSTSDVSTSGFGAAASSSSPNDVPSPQTADPMWKPYVNEDTDYTKWTVLREGDGGRHVHELQVALVQKGFWPGEDDMLWWQFGDATCSAVQTFQASANLPESGVVTSDTWQALLGKDAKPIDAKMLALNDETDEDMTAEHDGIYLIGEQRWERRPKPTL